MDDDTIFPALSGGETIMGKYRGVERSQVTKAIIIVTNFRLLIRWKGTICGCFTRSSYSSIILDSIDRIDHTRPNKDLEIFSIFLLLGGLASLICRFIVEQNWLLPLGIIVTILAVVAFVAAILSNKKKIITLKGSFGSETVILEKTIAMEFEGQLSEMIHQRRTQRFIAQSGHYGPCILPEPLAPMPSRHLIEAERKQMNKEQKYAYDPLPNVA